MPASSISSRSCRARIASRSASRVVAITQRCFAVVAITQRCFAAVAKADDGTESEGVPSPVRMASAVELDRVPAETARPTDRNHGWAGFSDRAAGELPGSDRTHRIHQPALLNRRSPAWRSSAPYRVTTSSSSSGGTPQSASRSTAVRVVIASRWDCCRGENDILHSPTSNIYSIILTPNGDKYFA